MAWWTGLIQSWLHGGAAEGMVEPAELGLVRNLIKQVNDGRKRLLDPTKVNKLIIHRVGKNLKAKRPVDWGDGATEIIPRLMSEAGKSLGYQVPYTFFIREDGGIEQTLGLYEYGPHAAKFNATGIGIAVIGDPRVKEPTVEQYKSLIWVCAVIADVTGIPISNIYGHTELPNASRDPTKECPGKHLPMDRLKHDVRARRDALRRKRLWEYGISYAG